MTAKEFLRALAGGDSDIMQEVIDILSETGTEYCVIGGLAVNAFVEPVVSMDLDLVLIADRIETVLAAGRNRGFRVEHFEHSINLAKPPSALRIQIQMDQRYQEFIPRSEKLTVLDYRMSVARIEDVLRGKIWAYQDETRRKSKRRKDLADITRILESYPDLNELVPPEMRPLVE